MSEQADSGFTLDEAKARGWLANNNRGHRLRPERLRGRESRAG